MLKSKIAIIATAIASLSLSACSTVTNGVDRTMTTIGNGFGSIFGGQRAQAPERVPVVYTYGYGYNNGYYSYKHCYRVKAKHVHGKLIPRHVVCSHNYYHGARGYYGCTRYIPSYFSGNRTCSKWEWMPSRHYYNSYNDSTYVK